MRHDTVRTTPGSAEQSTSTASPSAGSARERRGHHARHLVLAADDADVRQRRPRQAHHRGELVEDRREERRARVGDARDDAFGASCPSARARRRATTGAATCPAPAPPRTPGFRVPMSGTAMECSRDAAITIGPCRRSTTTRGCSCTRSGCAASSSSTTTTIVTRLVDAGLRRARGPRACASRPGAATPTPSGPASRRAATTRRRCGAAYERFLPLNRELIRICNDWQVRPGGVPERPPRPRATTGR